MDDYITRQSALKAIKFAEPDCEYEAVEEVPSADVQPVRHGQWETVEGWDGDEYYRCSDCGAEFVLIDGTPNDNDYLYCPHCGALMDEVT